MPTKSSKNKQVVFPRKDAKGTIVITPHADWNWSNVHISFRGVRGAERWFKAIALGAVPFFIEKLKPAIGLTKAQVDAVLDVVHMQCHTVPERSRMLILNAEEISAALHVVTHDFVVAPAEEEGADASSSV